MSPPGRQFVESVTVAFVMCHAVAALVRASRMSARLSMFQPPLIATVFVARVFRAIQMPVNLAPIVGSTTTTYVVEPRGFEPLTSSMPLRRSTN